MVSVTPPTFIYAQTHDIGFCPIASRMGEARIVWHVKPSNRQPHLASGEIKGGGNGDEAPAQRRSGCGRSSHQALRSPAHDKPAALRLALAEAPHRRPQGESRCAAPALRMASPPPLRGQPYRRRQLQQRPGQSPASMPSLPPAAPRVAARAPMSSSTLKSTMCNRPHLIASTISGDRCMNGPGRCLVPPSASATKCGRHRQANSPLPAAWLILSKALVQYRQR